jgi:hypothetical protein
VKKLLRRLVILGAIAGGIYALRNYLRAESAPSGSAQMVFDDGSTRSLTPNTAEGREIVDVARRIVEIGL